MSEDYSYMQNWLERYPNLDLTKMNQLASIILIGLGGLKK